ncbi:MAG: flavin reductase-like protein [Frankiales bacterium]|jgi:flavin reductase (DIM6/NTAB) family NADH-FMN oxidoreductase RutF|nr:flavin reductase-like protein [Frankiales bacterium]
MTAVDARGTRRVQALAREAGVEAAGPVDLRKAYGCFPSGVAAVAALVDGEPVGMAASTFTAVSLEPALVSLCIQRTSTTWPRLRELPRLGLSVLAEGQDAVCRSLSAKAGDRFAGVAWERHDDGAVLIQDATLWLDCTLHSELPAGDHLIALLQVHGVHAQPEAAPLVFHGSLFRQLATL